MRCSDIMKAQPIAVRETDSVQQACRLMRDNNIGFLPVVDGEKRAVGTITDRDVAIRVCADDLTASTCRIGQVMSRELVACRPQDELELAEDLMKRYHKSRIVVLDDDDVLKGIISLSDVAENVSPEASGRTLRDVASRETRPS